MGDISTWSPVDESNTAAPPDGWPEGQATNSVNNCARAMMGATRRWYDTVTAQLASLTSALTGYLPLSGGTLSGTLSAVSYNLSGVPFAFSDANYHYIYDKDGITASIALGGSASGNANLYRATIHNFQANDGTATFATLDATGVFVGNLTSAGTSNLQAVTATTILASATVTGLEVNSNGHINAIQNITAIGGNITAGNGSTGGSITSTYPGQFVGNACSITSGVIGNLVVPNNLDAGDIDCVGNIDAASYTRGGVPMVMLTQSQFDQIEARLAALETMGTRQPA